MSLEVRIQGAASLHKLAARIRTEGRADLSRRMSAALNEATDPVRASIRESAAATMPGWYANTLTKSLRFRNARRAGGNQASLRLTTYADGQKERRDVRALEDGRLRHPLYGNRDHWYVTKIRAGFHRRGTDNAMEEVLARLDVVVRDFTARLIR